MTSERIATIDVELNGTTYPVQIMYHENPTCEFTGKKLHHPFETVTIPLENKKKWESDPMIYDTKFAKGAEEDLHHSETHFYLKIDGSCGQIRDGKARRRHDIKVKGRTFNLPEAADYATYEYEQCEEPPVIPAGKIPDGLHWPHMRNVATTATAIKKMGDKWYDVCAKTFMASEWYAQQQNAFIPGEFMGPNIQGCKSDPMDVHTFVPFNMIEFIIPIELRNQQGFGALFTKIPNIEGLVVYAPEHMYKIRGNMYLDVLGQNVEWGKTYSLEAMPKELQDVFTSAEARNFAEYLVKKAKLA